MASFDTGTKRALQGFGLTLLASFASLKVTGAYLAPNANLSLINLPPPHLFSGINQPEDVAYGLQSLHFESRRRVHVLSGISSQIHSPKTMKPPGSVARGRPRCMGGTRRRDLSKHSRRLVSYVVPSFPSQCASLKVCVIS